MLMVLMKVRKKRSSLTQNEVMPFAATSMDLEDIILSEVSQIEKERLYHLYVES